MPARVALALLVIYLAATSITQGHRTDRRVDRVVRQTIPRVNAGTCLFFGDIAGYARSVDVARQPAALGGAILADSFVAYEVLGCTSIYGKLPAPPSWLADDVTRARARSKAKLSGAPPSAPSGSRVR